MAKKKWLISIGISLAVVMGLVGCSDKESSADKENTEESNQSEEKYSVEGLSKTEVKKADELALNFFQAYAEEDAKKLAKYYADEDMLDYEMNDHEYPKYIDALGEKYKMVRYDDYYSKQNGLLYYHIYQPENVEVNQFSPSKNQWVTLRKNKNGEWNAVKNGSFNPRVQPDEVKDINSGTILHDVPEK